MDDGLIRYLCADLRDVDWPEADLYVLDPPWLYDKKSSVGASRPSDHYRCLPMPEIHALCRRFRSRGLWKRLALWGCGPQLREWLRGDDGTWNDFLTMGTWVKSARGIAGDALVEEDDDGDEGHYGQGYHWAGCQEPVLLYTKDPEYNDRACPLRNAWVERPGAHSRKPVAWMVKWIRRWVPPGGLVCDPFAGLASVAEAAVLAGEGRRYLGTELDAKRHAEGAVLLAAAMRDGVAVLEQLRAESGAQAVLFGRRP